MRTPRRRAPNRWWADRPGEIYWFETTDRVDLGRDLNAPQFGEEGKPHWSYDFVNEVTEGDVELHYNARPNKALVGWSRVVGQPYADDVVWGAHGAASGRGPVTPYRRPGGASVSTGRTSSMTPFPSNGFGNLSPPCCRSRST